jgi:hypothetical protein
MIVTDHENTREDKDIEAVFHCRKCGAIAGTIRLRLGRRDSMNLIIEGFIGKISQSVPDSLKAGVGELILAANAGAIYRHDPSMVPWYCPECDCSYCLDHWLVETSFDADFEPWYDCSHGTCPQGHRRMIDD